jgi:starvation-inducible DNA-binding protein
MNYIGIKEIEITETVDSLNTLLANYHIYYQNLRNYHWNISGEHFFDLHQKFEDLYNDAKTSIDEIAERILTLRKKPISTLKEYLEISDVKEMKANDANTMVENILENHKIIIKNMRTTIAKASTAEDEGTIDLLGGYLANLEKKSWMLDAWNSKS